MARVLRAGGACLLGLAGAALGGAPAQAADVFFQAQATATAVHVVITQQPPSSFISASLIDDAVAYAASDFDSGGSSEAQAAPAYPGTLVVDGPALFCTEVFTCPASPPAYPLLADASYPRTPKDSAQLSGQPAGSGPFVVTPLTATATAGPDANSGATSAGRASVLAGTPVAVEVGASQATSDVTTTADTLHVHVESVLHDVTIGGLVHVGTVHSVDDLTVVHGRRPVDRPSVTVAGVTVNGVSASIDDRGIHVAGQDGPSLTKQLSQSGISVRTLGVDRADTATGGRSDATGLSVDFAIPVSGVPYVPNPLPPLPPPLDQIPQLPGVNVNGTYVGHVTLGAVGAAGGVQQEPTFSLGGFGGVGSPPGGGASGVNAAAGPAPGGQGAAGRLGRSGAGQAAPQVAPPPGRGPIRVLLDVLSKVQLETLYAVLALGTVALFVGWRGIMLVRQGGSGAWRRR